METRQLLPAGAPVIIGVSGGADSACLLDCLVRLKYEVVAVYFDHMLRSESHAEMQSVRAFAQTYPVAFETGGQDVAAFTCQGYSIEEAARILRYRHLAQVAHSHGIHYIAVGHTADDNVETILMHFLRGAGVTGLRGIQFCTSLNEAVPLSNGTGIKLIRPLLEISRAETETHCDGIGYSPVMDASNQDTSFFRNRLRHELLPLLETYNPGIRAGLLRTAQIMNTVSLLNENLTEKFIKTNVYISGEKAFGFRRDDFNQLPEAIKREVVRSLYFRLKESERDLSFDIVLQCIAAIAAGKPEKYPLAGDLLLWQTDSEAIIAGRDTSFMIQGYPQVETCEPQPIVKSGEFSLQNDWQLLILQDVPFDRVQQMRDTYGMENVAAFAALGAEQLFIRSRRDGDRISPSGMEGRAKLSDLMINNHIPFLARSKWPVLTIADEIVWVPGLRRSAAYLVEQDDQVAWMLVLTRTFSLKGLRPRYNLWLEKENEVAISHWRVRLLEAIRETGSITAAAVRMKVPYRKAWERVQEMESVLKMRLVNTETGGTGGGGAFLTDIALQLIHDFHQYESGFEEFMDRKFYQTCAGKSLRDDQQT